MLQLTARGREPVWAGQWGWSTQKKLGAEPFPSSWEWWLWGRAISPAGNLGLTPSLSGNQSSDLIFSTLECGDEFDSQNDLLTQPAWEGVSRTIQACSYAVWYSPVISLLPIPFHSRAVNHKWDSCLMLFSCMLYPVSISKGPASDEQQVSCTQGELVWQSSRQRTHPVPWRFTLHKAPLALCRYLQISPAKWTQRYL